MLASYSRTWRQGERSPIGGCHSKSQRSFPPSIPNCPPPPPRRRRDEDASALGFAVGSETEGALAAAAPLAISCWRGRGNLNVLVSKQVCCTCVYSMQGKLAPFVPWGRREPEGLSGRWVHGGRLA